MRSYEKRAHKPFRMRTYKFIGLKVLWNVYFQKKGVEGPAEYRDSATLCCGSRRMQ